VVTARAVNAMERGDVARWPEPVNDSVVMISFDGRVVVPNLRLSDGALDRGRGPCS